MAGDAENKRGYRTIFRSISQVFYANTKNSNTSPQNNNNISSPNNNLNSSSVNIDNNNEGIGRLTVTLTSITPPTNTWTSTSPTISTCTTESITSSLASAENISCQEECDDTQIDEEIEETLSDLPTPTDLDRSALKNLSENQKLRASSMLDLTSNNRTHSALRVSLYHHDNCQGGGVKYNMYIIRPPSSQPSITAIHHNQSSL